MKIAVMVYFFALLLATTSFANIKTISPAKDEIIPVKTALGIATIIQLPDAIQSAIIGDQSGYRIEYVDKAVTIKPLRSGAQTNLYLITSKARYNLRLQTGPQAQAYYILYVKDKDSGVDLKWKEVNKTVSGKSMDVRLRRIALTKDGFLLFDLSLNAKKSLKLEAEDFWIKQEGQSKIISSLYLSSSRASAKELINIGISVQKTGINAKPLVLEVKEDAETLRIELLKESP